jgi:hypothetical protein
MKSARAGELATGKPTLIFQIQNVFARISIALQANDGECDGIL